MTLNITRQGKIIHNSFDEYLWIMPAADTWRFQKLRPSSQGRGMTMLATGYPHHIRQLSKHVERVIRLGNKRLKFKVWEKMLNECWTFLSCYCSLCFSSMRWLFSLKICHGITESSKTCLGLTKFLSGCQKWLTEYVSSSFAYCVSYAWPLFQTANDSQTKVLVDRIVNNR